MRRIGSDLTASPRRGARLLTRPPLSSRALLRAAEITGPKRRRVGEGLEQLTEGFQWRGQRPPPNLRQSVERDRRVVMVLVVAPGIHRKEGPTLPPGCPIAMRPARGDVLGPHAKPKHCPLAGGQADEPKCRNEQDPGKDAHARHDDPEQCKPNPFPARNRVEASKDVPNVASAQSR
jgi:hypothetical protein